MPYFGVVRTNDDKFHAVISTPQTPDEHYHMLSYTDGKPITFPSMPTITEFCAVLSNTMMFDPDVSLKSEGWAAAASMDRVSLDWTRGHVCWYA